MILSRIEYIQYSNKNHKEVPECTIPIIVNKVFHLDVGAVLIAGRTSISFSSVEFHLLFLISLGTFIQAPVRARQRFPDHVRL